MGSVQPVVAAGCRPAVSLGRRPVLALAAGAVTASVAGCTTRSPARSTPAATVGRWRASRGDTYLIAHRGSGDVFPEHSLPAYRAALGWGAPCMELSVDRTSDGVLICMHDLTYDRTTTGHGRVSAQPSAVLDQIGIRQPQLGPAWLRPPLPRVPRLEQALALLGGHTVLALEAKDDAAYPAMMAMAVARGLRDSVVVKAFHTSPRIAQAKQDGYPVFAYFGNDATPAAIAALAARLDGRRDYLGLPAMSGRSSQPEDLIRGAVSHGVPVWVYPVHRRSDAAHYFALGVRGAVTSSYGYSAAQVPVATRDDWSSGAVASGQISRDPASPATAPTWGGGGELTLGAQGFPHWLTIGQLSPIAAGFGGYRIGVTARWATLPVDRSAGCCLAVARPDDRYYTVGLPSDGYNAVVSPDGRVRLLRHDSSSGTSTVLAQARLPEIATDAQVTMSLEVAPVELRLRAAVGLAAVQIAASDAAHRGGYVHLGRLSLDGRLGLQALQVTPVDSAAAGTPAG